MNASFYCSITADGALHHLPYFIARVAAGILMCAGLAQCAMAADVVETRNGERYLGQILSVTPTNVVLHSQTAGKLTLSKSHVASIQFDPEASPSGTSGRKNAATTPAGANAVSQQSLTALGSQTNLLEAVQRDLLSNASPEATQKFKEMVAGLMTGKLTVNDLKAQARSLSEQARAMRADLGEEGGVALDGYLAILDNFLQDKPVTAPGKPAPPTAKPTPSPAPAPAKPFAAPESSDPTTY